LVEVFPRHDLCALEAKRLLFRCCPRDGIECTSSAATRHRKEEAQCLPRSPRRSPPRNPLSKCRRPALPSWPKRSSRHRNEHCSTPSARAPAAGGIKHRGPFAVFLHAPEFGELAQQLGGYCRYKTAVPPRLSEFAILVTAKLWRAQYEWFAHVPQAERAGVKPATIRDLHQGRVPKSAPKDERAIYDFVQELYKHGV